MQMNRLMLFSVSALIMILGITLVVILVATAFVDTPRFAVWDRLKFHLFAVAFLLPPPSL